MKFYFELILNCEGSLLHTVILRPRLLPSCGLAPPQGHSAIDGERERTTAENSLYGLGLEGHVLLCSPFIGQS